MQIKTYFQQIQAAIAACRILQTSNVTYDERGSSQGFIRGELHFVDGSVFHFRQAVATELSIDRLMYTYQYMNAKGGSYVIHRRY